MLVIKGILCMYEEKEKKNILENRIIVIHTQRLENKHLTKTIGKKKIT